MKPPPVFLPALIIAFAATVPLTGSTVLTGEAYVYPPNLHGQPLPNGEIFRHDRLTAGHATIPPGTVARVTNLGNRRGIDVLITDQRTGTPNAILLSRAAATLIGITGTTAAHVTIEPLGHPVAGGRPSRSVEPRHRDFHLPASAPEPERPFTDRKVHDRAPGLYFLEFATYKNIVQATLLARKLTKRGAPGKVVQDQNAMYRVISDGYFTSLEDASKAYYLVKRNVGYTPVIKQI